MYTSKYYTTLYSSAHMHIFCNFDKSVDCKHVLTDFLVTSYYAYDTLLVYRVCDMYIV